MLSTSQKRLTLDLSYSHCLFKCWVEMLTGDTTANTGIHLPWVYVLKVLPNKAV